MHNKRTRRLVVGTECTERNLRCIEEWSFLFVSNFLSVPVFEKKRGRERETERKCIMFAVWHFESSSIVCFMIGKKSWERRSQRGHQRDELWLEWLLSRRAKLAAFVSTTVRTPDSIVWRSNAFEGWQRGKASRLCFYPLVAPVGAGLPGVPSRVLLSLSFCPYSIGKLKINAEHGKPRTSQYTNSSEIARHGRSLATVTNVDYGAS